MGHMNTAERQHWLHVTDQPDWQRQHIHDPDILIDDELAAITKAFPPNPQRILEIGCGYGRLTERIAALYPEADITGTDINPAVLSNPLPNFPQLLYQCRDNLTNMHGSYDAIYSVAVFQHLPHDEQHAYINQAHKALTPGGVLRIQFIKGTTHSHLNHPTPATTMTGWMRKAGFKVPPIERGLAHPQWTWITGRK